MAKVSVSIQLVNELRRKFSLAEGDEILDLFESLESSPHKGKSLHNIGRFVIKEIKYKKFRFYFITDGHVLKFGTEAELANLLIKFVRMSDKKDQKKIIEEIKIILKSMGFDTL